MVDIDRPQVAGCSRRSDSAKMVTILDFLAILGRRRYLKMKFVTDNASRGTLFPLGVTAVTVVVTVFAPVWF